MRFNARSTTRTGVAVHSQPVLPSPTMPTADILRALVAERDRINQAIAVLQGTVRRRGRPPGSKNTTKGTKKARKKRPISPAAKKRQSERMKAYWASRRKAANKKSKAA